MLVSGGPIDCNQNDDTIVNVNPKCSHFHGSVSSSACFSDIEVLLEDNSDASTCSVWSGDGQGLVSIWARPHSGDTVILLYPCFCDHTYILSCCWSAQLGFVEFCLSPIYSSSVHQGIMVDT